MSNVLQVALAELGRRVGRLEGLAAPAVASRNDGLRFFRADKDADDDLDALTDASWEAGSPAATGTMNWNTTFSVPSRARAIHVYISGTINWKAKSTTTNDSVVNTGVNNAIVPASAAGTSYWSGASGTVTMRVVGWFA